jgi:hypothetical protein
MDQAGAVNMTQLGNAMGQQRVDFQIWNYFLGVVALLHETHGIAHRLRPKFRNQLDCLINKHQFPRKHLSHQ